MADRPRDRRLIEQFDHRADHDGGRGGRASGGLPGHATRTRGRGRASRLLGGPRQNRTYELTRTSNGRIFIRYLPPDAEVGNRSARYTIVGTYPVENALEVLQKLSTQPGEKSAPAPGGGLAVYSTSSPGNVYVAYPGSDVQIEVFDPSAKRALRLVTSGRVAPVG